MTQKIYRAVETAITFKDSGGDAVITLANLGFGAGRVSAQYDRGAGSKPMRYKWKAVMQWTASPVVGEVAELNVAESDGTYIDGNVGAADAAFLTGVKADLTLIGLVGVTAASGATNMIASGVCHIWERYFSVGVWNASAAKNLQNTANVSLIVFTPMPDEIQADV